MVYDNMMTNLAKNTELKRVNAELIRKSVRTRDHSFYLIESSMGFPYLIDAADINCTERWASTERCAVRGELWECSKEALQHLDFFNGVPSVHQRKLVALQGEHEPAFIYLLKEANTIAAVCADRRKYLSVQPLGDWRAYLPASSETALAAAHAALPQTRVSTLLPGPHAVFSYGSNGIQQLRQRLKNPKLQFKPAILPNSLRIFCGASKNWEGGGVASIVPMPGWEVKGNIVQLSDEELRLLDRFEGASRQDPYDATPAKGYHRQDVHVLCEIDRQIQTIDAVLYVKNNPHWIRLPSNAYLAACQKNIDVFWPTERVEVRDWRGLLRGGTGTPHHAVETPTLRMPRTATGQQKSPLEAAEANPLLLLQGSSVSPIEAPPPSKRRKKAPVLAAAAALTDATAAAITSMNLVAASAGCVTDATTTTTSTTDTLSTTAAINTLSTPAPAHIDIASAANPSAATVASSLPAASPVLEATATEEAAGARADTTAAAAIITSQALTAAAADLTMVLTMGSASASVALGSAAETAPPSSVPATVGLQDATAAAAVAAVEAAASAAADAMTAAQIAQAAEEMADRVKREAAAKVALAVAAAEAAQTKVAEAQAAAQIAEVKVQDLIQEQSKS